MPKQEHKIYTKGGDKGKTSLLGGTRVSKSHIRVETYGTIDELVALLGMVRDHDLTPSLEKELLKIQERLFTAEAWVAAEDPSLTENLPPLYEEDIHDLERAIDKMNEGLPPLTLFILPGGHPAVSSLQFACTVCRRAERTLIKMMETEKVNPIIAKYLNRLSDYLFVAGRVMAQWHKIEPTPWIPDKK
ncbi:MAG: ATP:cob(I)alamin adenosyltransferase [Bacteroidetes bacterium]|nr:MAG: ATP:cob(I)alamin adenosyltransferase [Bacteroidota bacterium]PIE88510.1 MAG: ATP:cob(I)alamin adenosyltransferase [Bacteroidota bacterium]